MLAALYRIMDGAPFALKVRRFLQKLFDRVSRARTSTSTSTSFSFSIRRNPSRPLTLRLRTAVRPDRVQRTCVRARVCACVHSYVGGFCARFAVQTDEFQHYICYGYTESDQI